ncbi:MAG: histidine phosphatase family protein [Acidimicrobiales bacterium]
MRGRLVVVRHGATSWSISGRHTGRTDVPLEQSGEEPTRALGRRLAGHRFELVLTSPLERARRTCELAGLGARAELCDDLVEWDYGDYEGLTTAEIRAQRPGWTLWHDGVPGGETIDDVAGRARRVVERARAARGEVVAFGHGHILRIVAALWLGLDAQWAAALLLGTSAVGVLGWERDTPALGRWDDDGGALLP